MGLLDDAIREHLDLKRRRGADPSEIERAEREALGPVRRGPEPMAANDDLFSGEPHDGPGAEPFAEADGDHWEPTAAGSARGELPPHHDPGGEAREFYEDPLEHHGHGHDDEPYDEPARVRGGRLSRLFGRRSDAEPLHEHGPADEELADDHVDHEPVERHEPHGSEPPLEETHRPLAPTGDETVEYDVEHALADEPHAHPHTPEPRKAEPAVPGEHDALEETPDFLQDTPDHDRLWFEQKPPRDFDFDH